MEYLIKTILLSSIFSINALGVSSYYENKVKSIYNSIVKLKPSIKFDEAKNLSQIIYSASEEFGIDYKIICTIINIESLFIQEAISSTNDISLAQISVNHWKNDKRLSKKGKDRLKYISKDPTQAIYVQAEILKILKDTYEKDDPRWFLRYHSSTKSLKDKYMFRFFDNYLKIKDI